ncbi:hypothetical protein Y1Q_0002312 [Alligator mississippiensis]|uniref:Uncharacterized protein n=1 Tax=Alligator mississippiensis TaxID=8496 RepID=A0A151MGN5_ALLMI|nr:hypothetical protein Y1Q_0002312 [Alligator mississippiensis]
MLEPGSSGGHNRSERRLKKYIVLERGRAFRFCFRKETDENTGENLLHLYSHRKKYFKERIPTKKIVGYFLPALPILGGKENRQGNILQSINQSINQNCSVVLCASTMNKNTGILTTEPAHWSGRKQEALKTTWESLALQDFQDSFSGT